jgi:hypothetical protein
VVDRVRDNTKSSISAARTETVNGGNEPATVEANVSVKESIGLIGMGLLLGGFGSLFLLNLFGVADEMGERAYRQSAWMRGIPPWKSMASPAEHQKLLWSRRSARAPGRYDLKLWIGDRHEGVAYLPH